MLSSMVVTMCRTFILFTNFVSIISPSSFLNWSKATPEQIQAAAIIGIQARQQFLVTIRSSHFNSLTSRERKLIYLEGLKKCNQIDNEQIDNIDRNIIQKKMRENDAKKLEKTGLSAFFSAFVTLPDFEMKRVADVACAKHEQQLECGYHYEGRAKTERQIIDLLEEGANRQMFEHECVDDNYSIRAYPCLGSTEKWFPACQNKIHFYSEIRNRVNRNISLIYDAAIKTIQIVNKEKEEVFTKTINYISNAEGKKCLAFKQMRQCIFEQLIINCGEETAEAFMTTISVGYLKRERSERVQMDFDTFSIPTHQICENL